MILFPAIDLKDGQCVRLRQGVMASAQAFEHDPTEQARIFEAAGFRWLHCVDLDGAFEGRSVNEAAIRAIREAVALPIQLGGGIRSREAIAQWLELGIDRVILGTVALRDPRLVRDAAGAYPTRIVVGIDARSGKVAVEGWAQVSEISAVDLARQFEDAGVAAIVFTDIARDGMLGGVNVEATARLADAVRIPVIASGGVGSMGDIEALVELRHPNIAGVIVGRALYDGRLNVCDAIMLANRAARGTGDRRFSL